MRIKNGVGTGRVGGVDGLQHQYHFRTGTSQTYILQSTQIIRVHTTGHAVLKQTLHQEWNSEHIYAVRSQRLDGLRVRPSVVLVEDTGNILLAEFSDGLAGAEP